ncbi:hypothetical protein F5J12DRAFT_847721 [Pisolithus orientalis]|uniref:uncharacterized protein n=1 Tax=Pisolithus orientalis TaxID=936130 RepID=UPI0022247CE7|nr:uncharacterized protein F5J12DRAFT_847721 [Pisolithus orientalis]KAI5999342.1 hypothetical protein F5J12DRAFT_847721 [Pisolithus orientalis]
MSPIGSVFLGDVQHRHRILTSSPPPSSPPAHAASNSMSMALASSKSLDETFDSVDGGPDLPEQASMSVAQRQEPTHPHPTSTPGATQLPTSIDPALSLELRIRWLEALLIGVRQDPRERRGRGDKLTDLKDGETTLIRLAENVQHRLNSVIESNDGLKKFMSQYDRHAHLLTPTFAYSGTPVGPGPSYGNMSAEELEALLAEMEPDIRAADRDMREIDLLIQKDVLSAGKLPDYEVLQPRVKRLLAAQEEDLKLAASLEKRIANLVDRHATHVDALSELFVAWDDVLSGAESKVAQLERDKIEKQKLGYE